MDSVPTLPRAFPRLIHPRQAQGFYLPGLHAEPDRRSFAHRSHDDVFQQACFRGANITRKFNRHVALAAFNLHKARDGCISPKFHLARRGNEI